MLTGELRAFTDACAGRADYPVRPAEALRNVAVIEAIRVSAENQGAWVRVAGTPSA